MAAAACLALATGGAVGQANAAPATTVPVVAPVVPMGSPDKLVYKASAGKSIAVKLSSKKYCLLSGTTVKVTVKSTVAKGTNLCQGRMTVKDYMGPDGTAVYADFTATKGSGKRINYKLKLSPRVAIAAASHFTVYASPWAIGYMVGGELVDSAIGNSGWFNGIKKTKVDLFTNFAELTCADDTGTCRTSGFYIRRLPVTVKYV